MGRPLHTNWSLHILQPVLAPIRYGHQTLEVHLVKSSSTRETISKGVDVPNAEPMESRRKKLLERIKKDILSGPTLSRPDPSRGFYIKTDWSKDGMGAVILQVDVSEEAKNPEAQ